MLESKIEELTRQIQLLIETIDRMGALRIPVQSVIEQTVVETNNDIRKEEKETKNDIKEEKSLKGTDNNINRDDLKAQCLKIVREDRTKKNKIKAILESFGTSKVADLKDEDLVKFSKALGEL